MLPLRLCILLSALAAAGAGAGADRSAEPTEARLWQALQRGEAVALMRHALAPGTGDPPDFAVDDCATQRNLSAEGREQARAIGERFRRNGIDEAQVYSSSWCRCLDTARLLALGEVRAFDGLNSFFRNRAAESGRTAATRTLIDERAVPGRPPLVLVTHQVNITALTGVFPASGEMIVVRPGANGPETLGRIDTR